MLTENTLNYSKLFEQAMALKSNKKFILIEGLLKSLDEPNPKVDEVWAQEATKRLKLYREGKLEGIAAEDVL